MFSHPVAICGYFALGFGFVVAFLSASDPFGPLFAFSVGLNGLGCFLVLIGVVAQGFLRVERYLSGNAAMKAAFDASTPKTVANEIRPQSAVVENAPIDPQVLQKKLDQLNLNRKQGY